MKRAWRLARWALAASVGLLSPELHGQEQRLKVAIELHTPSDGDCIRKADLEAALGKQSPPVMIAAQQPDLLVDVELARREEGSGWRGTLRVSSTSGAVWGERELEVASASCRAADEELKFMIGLAAQGTLFEPPVAAPQPAPVKASVPPPAPQPAAPRRTPERAPRGLRWQIAFDTALLGGVRLLPSPAVGAELGALLVAPFNAGARVRVSGYVPQALTADDAHIALSYLSTAGSVCPLLTRGRWRGDTCIGLSWTVLAASSSGAGAAVSSRRSLLEGLVSGALLLQLMPSWWLGTFAELSVPLKRDRYVLTRAPAEPLVVFQAPTYSLAIGLGARVAL